MIVYIENPIDSTKTLLNLISEFWQSNGLNLIFLIWCSWDALYAIYVGSLVVIGFWLFWGGSLASPSFQLAEGHSAHHILYADVQVLSKQNHTAQETNLHLQK